MSVNAAELIVLTKAVGALDAQLALEAVGAAVVAAGVESVKMAGDFQSSVTKLYTTAGEAHSNLKMVSDGILNMSASVGTGAQQLVQAMYWVESGGLHGAKALEALRVAAQAAKAENADLDKVSIALAASLNAYAGSGMSAVQVMNTLTAATGQGMMTFEQLSGSLASVLPAAAKFGISLNNVTAALATMTAQGDPAEQAATHLKQVILALEAPSKIGAAALKSVGLTSSEVADEMRKNLPDALKMITDAVGKKFPEGSAAYNQAIKNIAGGSKQMMGFLELTGTHMSTFADNVGKISSAVQKGGNDLMGWSDIQQNFNFKMDAATAAVGVLAIKVGTALLPSLGQLLDKVTPLIQNFSDWVVKNHVVENSIAAVGTAITTTVGFIQNLIAIGTSVVQFFQQNEVAAAALGVAIGALGGILALFAASSVADMILSLLDYGLSMLTAASETVTAATVMTSTFAEMSGMIIASMGTTATAILSTLGPFLLVGAVVAAVGIGIVLAIQHWGEISQWFSGVWAGVVSGFNSAIGGMNYALQASLQWWNDWKTPILIVAGAITLFFLPALIQVGVQAAITAATTLSSFGSMLVQLGLMAITSSASITTSFIASMIETGTQAVISAAKVTFVFVVSMVQAGLAAIVSAAQITYSFVASLIATGVQGWIAAGKLVPLTLAMIATGTEGMIAGGKIVLGFVGGMVAAALEADISAATITTTIIPALYATGVAAYAALGPFGILAGVVVGMIALLEKYDGFATKDLPPSMVRTRDSFQTLQLTAGDTATSVTSSVDKMATDVPLSFDMMASKSQHGFTMIVDGSTKMHGDITKQMQGIQSDSTNALYQMQYSGVADMNKLSAGVQNALNQINGPANKKKLTDFGSGMNAVFDATKVHSINDLAQIDNSTQTYLQSILDYVNQAKNALNDLNAWNSKSTAEQKIQMQHGTGGVYNKNAYASGTDFAAGGMALIGEQGPEIMYIPRGAQIIPNNQIASVGSGHAPPPSSGSKQPVIINLNVNGQLFARQLLPDLAHAIQYGTGITL